MRIAATTIDLVVEAIAKNMCSIQLVNVFWCIQLTAIQEMAPTMAHDRGRQCHSRRQNAVSNTLRVKDQITAGLLRIRGLLIELSGVDPDR